jgi:drug/metabolite transporter (DMT)-like permease
LHALVVALYGVTFAGLTCGLLLVLRRRPALHWPATLCVFLLGVLLLVMCGQRHELPEFGLGVGLSVFFLAPLAVMLATLRLPLLQRKPRLVLVAAPLAFVLGIFLSIVLAVNFDYLTP